MVHGIVTSDLGVEQRQETRGEKVVSKKPIKVMKERCKGCDICISFCPHSVLTKGPDGKVVVSDPDACRRCKLCEHLCPDFGLKVLDADAVDDPDEEAGSDD